VSTKLGEIHLGFENVFQMLGGGIELFALFPFIVFIWFRYVQHEELLRSLLFVVGGLILVNLFYGINSTNFVETSLLVIILHVIIFFILVSFGYAFALAYLFRTMGKDSNQKSIEEDKILTIVFISTLILPILSLLPILNNATDLSFDFIFIYAFVMGGMAISSFVFTIVFNRKVTIIPQDKLPESLIEILFRLNRIQKRTLMGFIVLIIFSFFSEFEYRGNWLVWGETYLILLLFILFMFKIMKLVTYLSINTTEGTSIVEIHRFNKKKIAVIYFSIVSFLLLFDIFL